GATANCGINLDQSANTLTIVVTSVYDAPPDTHTSPTRRSSDLHVFTAAEFGFTDPNDSPANLLQAVTITTTPAAGALTLNNLARTAEPRVNSSHIATAHVMFCPATNANGAGYAAFTFQVQDDGG